MVTETLNRPCPNSQSSFDHTTFFPHRKAVEMLGMYCPGKRLFLWEPWGRDLCDNMTCEPALYGHDKDSSDTRVYQTDRGSGDKRAAMRLIHLFGGGEVLRKTSRFSSDLPLCHFSVVLVQPWELTSTNHVTDVRINIWPTQVMYVGFWNTSQRSVWFGFRYLHSYF